MTNSAPYELPATWHPYLQDELSQPYFHQLVQFVDQQRAEHEVFPAEGKVFEALRLTSPKTVRVLVLGQDPYHGVGQAHGLSFSVLPGVKHPPSLRNIFQELRSDVGCETPRHGCLVHWAQQGVLLLNTVLTVQAHQANSHRKQGWEKFTDRVIQVVNDLPQSVAFVLWGNPAQKKSKLINADHHLVIESAHPSPLSAHRGFMGSKPFSRVNAFLAGQGSAQIDWQIP